MTPDISDSADPPDVSENLDRYDDVDDKLAVWCLIDLSTKINIIFSHIGRFGSF